MRRALTVFACVAAVLAGFAGAPSLRAAPAPPEPCLEKSSGVKPKPTSDDVADCVYQRLDPRRVRVTVAYTYASPLGRQNIWLGADLLAGGNRLGWFGFRPAPITASSGTASLELIYGFNSPPASVTTDTIEFSMYVGGAQVFFRKAFALKLDWKL